ncbi:MAG: BREX-1 system adenine-specific DNA-methyltransferase PglX, partial [Desulfobacula sp.]|nr:BREX-1 system adenine-specific DNA-methyltransferase PglX [Desulfobacula sp.]
MNTSHLKQFAQNARRQLIELVSTKLSIVLDAGSAARRENEKAVKDLEKEISRTSEDQVIEKVAYIWFNRFCALRFMDVNRYTNIGVVSPSEGFSQPEILMEAKQGHIDAGLRIDKDRVFGLLNETIPSPEPQQEAYRMLLVAVCNDYNSIMPFLFEKIADFTELLMPDDLLSDSSILTATREALSEEACADVEVIGWLYQFYISEKKDEVFAGLKKNKKVTPEDIPAATQLFTPNWIVRYLVENSLGRLWMLNNPNSKLIDKMEYYIKPGQTEADFLKVDSPEEIKICDPACGSGHMLVYAFDILYSIYEEEGYEAPEIPQLILKKNLFGIEIDERAGELAAFALFMKGRQRYRRFFRKSEKPNICVLENIDFESNEVKNYMDKVGRDLLTMDFQTLLYDFKEADNFGSLIRPSLTDVNYISSLLEDKKINDDLFLQGIHKRVLKALKQADYLSPKYHVVIANPPYMGGKGMNGRLGKWLKDNFSDVKSDLFSAFMVRNTELALPKGQLGFMSPFVWMFIKSYEKLRIFIINNKTITSLVQLEYSGFDGATVPICTFTVENDYHPDFQGGYVRLSDFRGSANQGPKTLEAIKNPKCEWFYRASSSEFKKIPGRQIAYWVNNKIIAIFDKYPPLSTKLFSDGANKTGNNDKYLRYFWEVRSDSVQTKENRNSKWLFCAKGGEFRRWYGNIIHLINWDKDIREHYSKDKVARLLNEDYWYRDGITWGRITSSENIGFRILPQTATFETAGTSIFPYEEDPKLIISALCLLSSKIGQLIFRILNPTLVLQ